MTDLVLQQAEQSRRAPATGLRVGWLGHRSQTIGDGLRTYSRIATGALAERGAHIVFVHHERGLDDGRSSFSLRGTPVFQRRLVVSRGRSRDLLERILREQRVDVVHLSAPFSTLDFSLPRLCRRIGVPLVVSFHVPFAASVSVWSTLAATTYRLYARALADADRVIVMGLAQRDLLLRLGVPESRIAVLHNGIDLARYSPGPSAALEWFDAERLFCYFGRVDPEKRVESLVRAFLEAAPSPRTRLAVVGGGVDLAKLRRRYADPRIVFTGAILDEQRRIDILRGADAFFLPSLLEAESLAVMEAMACGVAVVATDVGNHREVLEGAGAVLSPDRLRDELRMAMRLLVDSSEECRRMGALARERAVQLFELRAHVEALLYTYDAVISAATLVRS